MSTLYIHNGKVYINYSFEGKQIRKSLKIKPVNGRIPQEAKQIQSKIDSEISLGIFGLNQKKKVKRISVKQFTDEYINYCLERQRKSSTTMSNERTMQRRLKEHFTDDKIIRDITIKDADDFIAKLSKDKKAYTINMYIRGYRAMFNVALKWEYVSDNIFKQVSKAVVEDPIPRVLTADEVKKLIQTVEGQFPHLTDLFYFYMLTGFRLSEALRLQWSDIDFDNRVIRVVKAKNHRGRVVLMAKKVYEILYNRKNLPMPFAEFFEKRFRISKDFSKLFSVAAVNDATLKTLRSNFASYLANVGVEQSINQKMLGHTEQVSKRHYIGLVPALVNKQIDEIEVLLTTPNTETHSNNLALSDHQPK